MHNNDVCNNECQNRHHGNGSSGLLIVVVLYILLAILFSSFTGCY